MKNDIIIAGVGGQGILSIAAIIALDVSGAMTRRLAITSCE